jgi:hypothetical protein
VLTVHTCIGVALEEGPRAFRLRPGECNRDFFGVADLVADRACMDAIHSARVFGWIEQPNVSLVHSQAGEPSIVGSLAQDLAGVSVPLDSSNWRVSEDEVGEESTAGSSE